MLKADRKGCYDYTGNKRKIKGYVFLLVGGVGDLVRKDMGGKSKMYNMSCFGFHW